MLIFGGIALATADLLYRVAIRREARLEHYRRYRRHLTRSLFLDLEILVAADNVRTVALQTTFAAVAELGLLVAARTFLSWPERGSHHEQRCTERFSRELPAAAA